jgi:hypothetical protein
MKIINDGHYRSSERSHNRGKEGSKEKGIKIMSREDIDIGLAMLRIQLITLDNY